MAYFDGNDKVLNQFKDRLGETSLGPTITIDPVTGEIILGGKKNPKKRDWQKAYESYVSKGGDTLSTPAGMSATRMYQHPLFKGKGLSYYSSAPYTSTFLNEMQSDIEEKKEEAAATTPATSVGQLKRREEELYSDTEGGSPPGDPAPSDWDIASGPELFQEEVPALSDRYSDLFSLDPSKTAASVAFQKSGEVLGIGTLTNVIGLGVTGAHVLKSIFGENHYEKVEKEMLEDTKLWTPPDLPVHMQVTPFTGKAPPWGDAEGGYVAPGEDYSPSPSQEQVAATPVTEHVYGDPDMGDTEGGSVGGGGADTDSGTTGQGAGEEADVDTAMGDDL